MGCRRDRDVRCLGSHVASTHRYGEYECETCGEICLSLAAYRSHRGGHASIGRDERTRR
ncbi:hypothetical protein GJ633_01425 [Halorubrum sp. CBA1125]|nr:hypothetical protein [Halorubrum sp. CBA1125]